MIAPRLTRDELAVTRAALDQLDAAIRDLEARYRDALGADTIRALRGSLHDLERSYGYVKRRAELVAALVCRYCGLHSRSAAGFASHVGWRHPEAPEASPLYREAGGWPPA